MSRQQQQQQQQQHVTMITPAPVGDALRHEVFRSMNVSTSSKTPYSDATQVSQTDVRRNA